MGGNEEGRGVGLRCRIGGWVCEELWGVYLGHRQVGVVHVCGG